MVSAIWPIRIVKFEKVSSVEKIIDIRKYRRKRQNQFLKKYKKRIDLIIFNTLQKTMFIEISEYLDLIARMGSENEGYSWDYISFRDLVIESLDRQIGDQIYTNLKKKLWFDRRWFSRDQMLERAMSNLILSFPDLETKNYRTA